MDKVFVGSVEVKETKFGQMEKISFSKKDLETLTQHLNERGWVNLNKKKSKENKPYLEIDTWKPTKKTTPQEDFDDLPF